jgi:hypothetical protein
LQGIIDKEKEEKENFNRTHPFQCGFTIKRSVLCTFRAVNLAGFKVHARSIHSWKPGDELKYVDVAAQVDSDNSTSAEADPLAAGTNTISALAVPRLAVTTVAAAGVAQLKAVRRCKACGATGHQKNSKKCPRNLQGNQSLALNSNSSESDDVDKNKNNADFISVSHSEHHPERDRNEVRNNALEVLAPPLVETIVKRL